jgi:hypothetical protein
MRTFIVKFIVKPMFMLAACAFVAIIATIVIPKGMRDAVSPKHEERATGGGASANAQDAKQCGTHPECPVGKICAMIYGAGPQCYTICTVGGRECGGDKTCMQVAALEERGPAASPNLMPIKDEADSNALLHLCVPWP